MSKNSYYATYDYKKNLYRKDVNISASNLPIYENTGNSLNAYMFANNVRNITKNRPNFQWSDLSSSNIRRSMFARAGSSFFDL